MKKYKAIDIARWFINRNQEDFNNGEDEKMTLLLCRRMFTCFGKQKFI